MGGGRTARAPVDRASPADLMQLATDVGPAPMHVGAVLVLDTGPGFSVQASPAAARRARPRRPPGPLRALLASRGERLDLVTASVPVSARQVATAGQLGNQVGVMPVTLPARDDLAARVTRIAAITRERKTAAPRHVGGAARTAVPAAGRHRLLR